ncbi:MAG: glycosyltransferase family 4 protein [Planctomycetes bacterium]|nr:glycosyltransferase family 4 protein [Planctomycetota bacterium]
MSGGPRVLLVGPLPRSGSSVGGTQVSFAELVLGLRERGRVQVEVLDTTRLLGRGRRRRVRDLLHALAIAWRILRRARSGDAVMFNASSEGFLLGGPLVWLATRLAGKPLVARAFGGGLDECLVRRSALARFLARWTILRSDLLLLQTRSLCERFAARGEVRHLPTSRRLPTRSPRRSPVCRRFVLVAQLRPEKGYREAIEALRSMPIDCTLTIAGAAMPDTDVELLRSSERVTWLGEVAPEHVAALLDEHDALLLPTYHEGEGLPGSIVEAFQHGLPVIATRWRALPELVNPAVNGLLVEPRDAMELGAAMLRLASDDSLFRQLREGALATGREHSADAACERVERWLSQVSCRPLSTALPRAPLDEVDAPLPRRDSRCEVEA